MSTFKVETPNGAQIVGAADEKDDADKFTVDVGDLMIVRPDGTEVSLADLPDDDEDDGEMPEIDEDDLPDTTPTTIHLYPVED